MIKQGLHEKCGFHSDILHGIPWFSNIVLHGITILNCMVLHSQEWQFVVNIAWYSVEKYKYYGSDYDYDSNGIVFCCVSPIWVLVRVWHIWLHKTSPFSLDR